MSKLRKRIYVLKRSLYACSPERRPEVERELAEAEAALAKQKQGVQRRKAKRTQSKREQKLKPATFKHRQKYSFAYNLRPVSAVKQQLRKVRKSLAGVSEDAIVRKTQLLLYKGRLELQLNAAVEPELLAALLALRKFCDTLVLTRLQLADFAVYRNAANAVLGEKPTTPCVIYEDDAARRIARRTVLGKRPGKMYVCHKCDVPECAADGHLFWGSAMENVRDMMLKGRGRSLHSLTPDEYVAKRQEQLQSKLSLLENVLDSLILSLKASL